MCFDWRNTCILNRDGKRFCRSDHEHEPPPDHLEICDEARARDGAPCSAPTVKWLPDEQCQACWDHNGRRDLVPAGGSTGNATASASGAAVQIGHPDIRIYGDRDGETPRPQFDPTRRRERTRPTISYSNLYGMWCDICQRQFSSLLRLRGHMVKHDPWPEIFECEFPGCVSTFLHWEQWQRHQQDLGHATAGPASSHMVTCHLCGFLCETASLSHHRNSAICQSIQRARDSALPGPSGSQQDQAINSSSLAYTFPTPSQPGTATPPPMQLDRGDYYCSVPGCSRAGINFVTSGALFEHARFEHGDGG